jgi:thiamine-phosphate pyrophosphorylase
MILPPLYPIIDFAALASQADPLGSMLRFAQALLQGGATFIQYRDKSGDSARMLSCVRELRRITEGRATLIVNDRADICLAAGADGVHLGQDDLSPAAVRKIFEDAEGKRLPHPSAPKLRNPPVLSSKRVGEQSPRLLIGFSTHNLDQVKEADAMPIDYLAVGPVFATASKANPDPVIGLQGVRQARAATAKPLVAIGGITRKNCVQVREAGADSVAVISDLLESPVKAVEEFLRILG